MLYVIRPFNVGPVLRRPIFLRVIHGGTYSSSKRLIWIPLITSHLPWYLNPLGPSPVEQFTMVFKSFGPFTKTTHYAAHVIWTIHVIEGNLDYALCPIQPGPSTFRSTGH